MFPFNPLCVGEMPLQITKLLLCVSTENFHQSILRDKLNMCFVRLSVNKFK